MFIEEFSVKNKYTRKSKLGVDHTYYRNKTLLKMRCDNCGDIFQREKGRMDPKRLSNNYFHVCEKCDAKKFAQSRAVKKKNMWNLPASSDIPISKL